MGRSKIKRFFTILFGDIEKEETLIDKVISGGDIIDIQIENIGGGNEFYILDLRKEKFYQAKNKTIKSQTFCIEFIDENKAIFSGELVTSQRWRVKLTKSNDSSIKYFAQVRLGNQTFFGHVPILYGIS